MIQMSDLTALAQQRLPDPGLAYFLMGLNAMVYLPPSQWQNRLGSLVNGSAIGYVAGSGQFAPNLIFVAQSGFSFVVIQGTQGWQGWAQYATGAGVTPWPTRPGQVFTPFYNLALPVVQAVKTTVPIGQAVLCFTGHSLGAAVAPLVQELLGFNYGFAPAYWFAQPRLGDLNYVANYPYKGFTFNNPIDPVPYLPADVIADLTSNPMAITAGGRFFGIGQARPACPTLPPFPPPNTEDFIVALAASIPDLRQSPHQTYWYIRLLFQLLPPIEQVYYTDYTQMLSDLGLLQPWPG